MNGVCLCAKGNCSSTSAQDPLTLDSPLEDLKPVLFCRCCLVTDQPLQHFDNKLADAYGRSITSTTIVECESCPKLICTYCYALLLKLSLFKEKCLAAQDALSDVQSKGLTITLDVIKNISKASYPLKIVHLKHLDLVPTCTKSTQSTNKDNSSAHFEVAVPVSFAQDIKTDESSNKNDIKKELISHSEDDILNDVDSSSDQDSDDEDSEIEELKSELLELKLLPISQTTKNAIKQTNIKKENSHTIEIKIERDDENVQDASCKKSKKINNKEQKQTKSEIKPTEITKVKLKKITKKQRLKLQEDELLCQKIKVTKVTLTPEEQKQEILNRRESINYKRNKHRCDLCYHAFTNKLTYDNHMKKHKPMPGQIACDICYTCFTRKRLGQHKSKVHTYNYLCKLCDHISKSIGNAKLHYHWHNGVNYKCQLCGQAFSKQTTLMSHMHIAHSDLMLHCTICNKQCNGEAGLRTHMNLSHKHAIDAKCASCGVQFHSLEALRRHCVTLDGATSCDRTLRPCPACGEGFPSDIMLSQHQLQCWTLQNPGIYRCGKCGKLYDDKEQFISHNLRSHQEDRKARGNGKRGARQSHEDDSLICYICGCTKATRQSLATHILTHSSTGEKRLKCGYCDRGFNVKTLLQQHIEAKHMGMARQHKCPYCNKGFDFIGNMKRHVQMIHQKLRPHSCVICNKKFAAKEGLQAHIRHTHEGLPWPKRQRTK